MSGVLVKLGSKVPEEVWQQAPPAELVRGLQARTD
jgi:hypothetical protein